MRTTRRSRASRSCSTTAAPSSSRPRPGALGTYTLSGLVASSQYKVWFRPPDGSPRVGQYWDHKLYFAIATPITLGADEARTGIDGDLVIGRKITGRVTNQADAPIKDVCVTAVSTAGGSGTARTATNGTYTINGVPLGDYKVRFELCDNVAGNYAMEYFDDKPNSTSANVVPVTASADGVADAVLAPGGSITGTVTVAGAAPQEQLCIDALDGQGAVVRGARTTTGTYSIGSLPTGSYRVRFKSCVSGSSIVTEYHADAATLGAATPVAVTSGQDTGGIDADLYKPPPDTTPPVTTISGVTVSGTTATVTFSADEPDATFYCGIDGAVATLCTSPKVYEGLASGEHRVVVVGKDAAGNFNTNNAEATFTVGGAATPTPTATATASPSATATSEPTPGASTTPTASPTAVPSASPVPSASVTPTATADPCPAARLALDKAKAKLKRAQGTLKKRKQALRRAAKAGRPRAAKRVKAAKKGVKRAKAAVARATQAAAGC